MSASAANRSASAGDDEVGHVGYWLVAEGGVDLGRGRVGLAGDQATRVPWAWIGREIPATALLAQPRPRWAGGGYTGPPRATPNAGGRTPVRCTCSPAGLTQNHSPPVRSRRGISARSGTSCALAPRGRPACSSASPMNAPNHSITRSTSPTVAARSHAHQACKRRDRGNQPLNGIMSHLLVRRHSLLPAIALGVFAERAHLPRVGRR